MRVRKTKMWRATRIAIVAGLTLATGLSPVWAAPVVTDDTNIPSFDASVWDASDNFDYGGGGPCNATDGFTPAEAGTGPGPGHRSDAFDGGLYLLVGSTTFNNNDDPGDLTGTTLTVGPQTVNGLNVTRMETGFAGRPALRSLVKLRNNSNSAVTRTIVWDSAMGADDSEQTRASSNGNTTHTTVDRWIVASDDADDGALSDPPLTFVFYGRGASTPVRDVLFAPEDPDPGTGRSGCVSVDYRVRVPAESTRYMMFFTEMHDSNTTAINDASVYNSVTYKSRFVTGMNHGQKAKLLNWQLVCPGLGAKVRNHVVGTSGNDTLVGTPGRDIICGGAGRDVIRGRGGRDLLLGGRGADALDGGPGTDTCRPGGQRGDRKRNCEH